jgi:hypothetical protein
MGTNPNLLSPAVSSTGASNGVLNDVNSYYVGFLNGESQFNQLVQGNCSSVKQILDTELFESDFGFMVEVDSQVSTLMKYDSIFEVEDISENYLLTICCLYKQCSFVIKKDVLKLRELHVLKIMLKDVQSKYNLIDSVESKFDKSIVKASKNTSPRYVNFNNSLAVVKQYLPVFYRILFDCMSDLNDVFLNDFVIYIKDD